MIRQNGGQPRARLINRVGKEQSVPEAVNSDRGTSGDGVSGTD